MADSTRVLPKHTATLGYCNAGLRKWFAEQEISFDTFRKEGVTCGWLRSKNNVMCNKLADYAESLEESS